MGKKIEDMTIDELIGHLKLQPQDPVYEAFERVPTGIWALDRALGGGWARGHMHEIWGEPGHGKSLLSMISANAVLEAGGTVIWLDIERSWDPKWAKNFISEPNSSNFKLLRPNRDTSAEIILDFIRQATERSVDLIVLDSKDALVYRPELEGEIGDANMGVRSRRLGHFVRVLNMTLGNSNCAFLFISQVRANLGPDAKYYPITTSGGYVIEHQTAIQVKMRQPSPLKDSKQIIGYIFGGKVTRNRTAPPNRDFEFTVQDFETDDGIVRLYDRWNDVFAAARDRELLRNASGEPFKGHGAVFFDGQKLGATREEAIRFLWENPDMLETIESALRE